MKHTKKLTILHSNDLHGDFTATQTDEKLIGGVSMLSGYVNQVRKEEKNVIYAIAGDMFRGSLIDHEYHGLSTIEIMNMLTPDIATVGNHEVDYGIAHLLFIEKCAKFPIINANIYIKTNHVRLFSSHYIKEIDGMKILFIGLLTEEVLATTRQDQYIGSFVDVEEASKAVGVICDNYRALDIDFTVLLTHIGIEADKELARVLDPNWGVDIIIGGHSHTLLEEPVVVNGIPIVQAASGTKQIGRFDIVVDTDENCIDSYTWKLEPIDADHCPRDFALEEIISRYKNETDEKYGRLITRFADVYHHERRNRETQLGRLFADILKDSLGVDVMMLGSGSLRKEAMGPIVDYKALSEMFPYDDAIHCVTLTGAQLQQAVQYIFRPEALKDGAHTEFYQYSHGLRFVVNKVKQTIEDMTWEGNEIDPDALYTIGLQDYHYKNIKDFLGLDLKTLKQNGTCKVVATSAISILDEHLSKMELVTAPEDERWITIEG